MHPNLIIRDLRLSLYVDIGQHRNSPHYIHRNLLYNQYEAWTSDINVTDKDSGFTGFKVSQFCNELNIALQAVIPGRHRSLRATVGRNWYFTDIIRQILDKWAKRKIDAVYWQEYESMCILR